MQISVARPWQDPNAQRQSCHSSDRACQRTIDPMNRETREALIEQYAAGPGVVTAALAGATERELDARPSAEEWSAREVAHHLADSEATSYIRLRKLVAEDDPIIYGYDEAEWARRLHYDRPVAASVAVLKSVRAATVELLRSLSEEEWQRGGTHTESGPYTVETWLTIYAAHAHDHATQISRARSSANASTSS
jgi:hypothetical protein